MIAPASKLGKGVAHQKRKVPFAFTPIPRTFFTWLPTLSGPEITVYLAIASETLAYNKFSASIPMTVLSERTGMHRASISRAIARLIDRELLRTTVAMKRVTRYEMLTPPAFDVSKLRHETEFDVAIMRHEEAV